MTCCFRNRKNLNVHAAVNCTAWVRVHRKDRTMYIERNARTPSKNLEPLWRKIILEYSQPSLVSFMSPSWHRSWFRIGIRRRNQSLLKFAKAVVCYRPRRLSCVYNTFIAQLTFLWLWPGISYVSSFHPSCLLLSYVNFNGEHIMYHHNSGERWDYWIRK